MKPIQFVAILIALTACAAPAAADMFFFGDSLSDSGNVFNLTGSPAAPYVGGRFSNGPTWAEVFADRMGHSAIASTAGGTNYAFGGARTGSNALTNLLDQVAVFGASGTAVDSTDVFVLWAGSNDIFDAAADSDPGILASAVDNIASAIGSLNGNGAENFIVLNAAPLGQTPFYKPLDPSIGDAVNGLSVLFNNGLAARLPALEIANGIDILQVDMYSQFEAIQASPESFGLANATDSSTPFNPITALSSGGPTVDPETYLFWDGIHPTAAGHRLIADHVFLSAVPEPSSLSLLTTLGLVLITRRRRD